MSPAPYHALANIGAKAIIHAGNGNVADYITDTLREIRSKGVFIVRASRTGSGVVVRNGEAPDDKYDWLVTGDQNPQKARLFMALALTKTTDTKQLQQILWKY